MGAIPTACRCGHTQLAGRYLVLGPADVGVRVLPEMISGIRYLWRTK